MTKKLLSLVVPIYYEEECVQQFLDETSEVLSAIDQPYEIIFVDDGSTDNTVELIRKNIEKNSRIRLVQFSYNHGKPSAVTAGIEYARGDYLLYMDPDLQDPPDEIPRFLEKIEQGYDLVFGIRSEKKDGFINRLYSKIFWNTLNKFTGLDIPKGIAVMRIFNREFANEFIKYREQNRFIEGIFMKIQKTFCTIEIKQRERFAGQTKFNFQKKMSMAFNAIYDFSEVPLKMTIRAGLVLCLLALLSIIGVIIAKLFIIDFQAGWPSLYSLIVFVTGIQLFFLGIIARYVGNIYKESKGRPLYSVKNLYNFEQE